MDAPLKIDGSADMEAPIRKLDQSGAEAVVFLGKVGLGISVEHLQKVETTQYDGIFLILDQEDLYTGETLDLPETLCVRLRFRGSHAEAHAQYRKLLDYIEKHQMQMIGFSREIALIDYGITNDTEKFVTEICIPVRISERHACRLWITGGRRHTALPCFIIKPLRRDASKAHPAGGVSNDLLLLSAQLFQRSFGGHLL